MDSIIHAAGNVAKKDWPLTAAVGLAALGLYFFTLAPTVLEADAGEFQFVPWLPGIAHPTGYPLYVISGWAWTHLLPLGDVAWRMNLLSAMFGAAAISAVFMTARQMLAVAFPNAPFAAQAICAAVAAVTFAVTPTFWSVAVVAEVYTLHALLVALLLWLAQKTTAAPKSGSSKLLALLFGLALAHHITTILLLPALGLYLWLAGATAEAAASPKKLARWLTLHAAIAAAPLLLYLYLPIIAPYTPYATLPLSDTQILVLYDNSVEGFFKHITATVFTGELQPAAVGADRFWMVWQLLQQQVGWVGVVLTGVGLLFLWQRRQKALLALTGLTALTITAFNLIYFIGDVFVLFIPVWLVVCLWLALGALGLTDWAARRFVQRKMGAPEEAAFGYMKDRLKQNMVRLVASILALFFFALPGVLLASNFAGVDQRHNTQASQRWQQILSEPIPESAVLLSNDRNEIMPMWYYQYVEEQRPDLVGLFPLITPDPAYATVGRVLDEALASGRTVFFIKPMDGLSLKANIKPYGSLYRATAPAAAPQHQVDARLSGPTSDSVTLLGYSIDPDPAQPGSSVIVTLFWQGAQPLAVNYASYVHLVDGTNNRIAQSDHQPGGEYYPTTLWQPGETLRDQHHLSMAETTPAGEYRLIAGMYHQPEPGQLVGLGNAIEIGALTID